MDLTAHVLRSALFRQAWKGYDTAEVDDFLDEVAAGVDHLEARVRDASERAERAEDRAVRAETRPALRSEPDESVRRTLVLAQRAADLVVTEAKSVSDRIIADAREHAAKILTVAAAQGDAAEQHAYTKAATIIEEAEATAERMTATRAAALQQELSGLIEQQAMRRLQLSQLTAQVERSRQSVRRHLQDHLDRLEGLRVPGPGEFGESIPGDGAQDGTRPGDNVLITHDDGPEVMSEAAAGSGGADVAITPAAPWVSP